MGAHPAASVADVGETLARVAAVAAGRDLVKALDDALARFS
jgi:hypothetical protein